MLPQPNPGAWTPGFSHPGRRSDPPATPATKALLRRLAVGGALGRVVGQHAQDIAPDYPLYVQGLADLVRSEYGIALWPAILSIAAEGLTGPLQIAVSAPYARNSMDAGGIVVLHWSPWNPWFVRLQRWVSRMHRPDRWRWDRCASPHERMR